jgi:hypothetical protein
VKSTCADHNLFSRSTKRPPEGGLSVALIGGWGC